jgi:DMSO reductase family type II enzyme molybdopterin subunit
MKLSRREFITTSAAAALGMSLTHLRFAEAVESAVALGKEYSYGAWQDIYRREWQWDKVARTTHFVNCWYQAHCAWNVYVKDGIVWREEQVGDYPQTRPGLPDFNPRGCQKGACYSHRMYDASRLKYPLKRTGERGQGKWKRMSWDDALTEIADTTLDAMSKEGTDRVVWSLGPLLTMGTMAAGVTRLGFLMDNTVLDMNTEIGDGHHGAAVTFGKIVAERSADDYFNSKLILIWGCNPLYTQIPNAHFLTEARYNGSRIVTISPDYNASAIHADLWVPVKPGTDAALAMSLAQVIVAEKLYDRNFLCEQTDLPLLVRDDTRRFLREKDMKQGGSDERFYVFDQTTNAPKEPPMTSLKLAGLSPSLEGTFEVETLQGKVKVRPVFEVLKERLAKDYSPEQASRITGTNPDVIRSLAREIAKAPTVANVTSSNWGKFYHGSLMERSQILVLALCGHMGKKGSGFSAFPFLSNDGFDRFVSAPPPGPAAAQFAHAIGARMAELKQRGFTDEMISYELSRESLKRGPWTSGTMFWQIHGGVVELSQDAGNWDPYLKRSPREYLKESLDKGWQSVSPPPGQPPRVIFEVGSNIVRRLRGYQQLFTHLYPKLTAFVTLDSRMSSTAVYSDYVLPVTAWYERDEHKWNTPLMPFIHAGTKVSNYYEAKSDWEISALLAKKIQERARARGIHKIKDRNGQERNIDRIYDDFSVGGKYGPTDDNKVASDLIKMSTNLKGVEWEELKKKGYARYTSVGTSSTSIGNACDIEPDQTISPFTWHTEKKMVYPTLTRRIQFYIDHDVYLELGEELPVHKDPPSAGGNYPLVLTGGHTRWSIHAAWRDDALMLREQRGEPVMYMSVADAKARGIADADIVQVKNDVGAFEIQVKVSPAARPGQVIIYHAWENYQFRGRKGFQDVMPSPMNPIELAGGQFHLRPMLICLQPAFNDRDTRVEVVRAATQSA